MFKFFFDLIILLGWWYNIVLLISMIVIGISIFLKYINEIMVLKVVVVQFVVGLFCIYNIFVDNEGGVFGVVCNVLVDLVNGFVFVEEIEQFFRSDVVVSLGLVGVVMVIKIYLIGGRYIFQIFDE